MEETKYLPIGSICSVENYNKPIMITGYYSISYNGTVKMYDYQGCEYPEGMLLNNKIISFNSKDIKNIIFKGYENEQYNNFVNILSEQTKKNDINNTKSIFKNIKFDENGVVVYEELNESSNEDKSIKFDDTTIKKDNNINNPFFATYEEKKVKEDEGKEWPIFKNIQFDENGIVVYAEENK